MIIFNFLILFFLLLSMRNVNQNLFFWDWENFAFERISVSISLMCALRL